MSEERAFYGYDRSGSGHDSEREAAIAAAERIIDRAGALVPVPRRFLLALMADLQAAKRALESVLLADLDPDQADEAMATATMTGSDDAEDTHMVMMTTATYPDWYMDVGPHNIPLVAPAIGVAFLTADGTPYRQDPDSGLIHVAERHVAELVGLGFSAAGPADSPGRQ